MPSPPEAAGENRGIIVYEFFEPNMPKLWADERAVRQVCLNLLSNGIKFTPKGGKIWLKVGWTNAGGQYLSVRDTGPGIPEEEIPWCSTRSVKDPMRSSRRSKAQAGPPHR